ncbi:MAG: hypothetical protein DM484_00800 [Candidatus Methylumidiphilus alinenensis]|uniref:Bacterial repeat domain-containing protein n=1 Tax=Candidatus Methylumidiphilus alinenensis TaxID=2202197 RepID=A0A2W4RRR6_9GAMM|nr:MAG: hypothetical protein DM484_00800 [Candidatus Methylumidiphilus alinenensis]
MKRNLMKTRILLVGVEIAFACLAIAHASALPYEGIWIGKTSQNYGIEISVQDGVALSVSTSYTGIGCTVTQTESFSGYSTGGQFSVGWQSHYSGVYNSTTDTWQGQVSLASTQCFGFAFGSWEASRVSRVSASPTSFETLETIATTDLPQSFPKNLKKLKFHGQFIWGINGGNVYKIDTTGGIVAIYSIPDASLAGIAFENDNLWLIGSVSGTGGWSLYKLDGGGNVIQSYKLQNVPFNGFSGLMFDGFYLWSTNTFGKLSKFSRSGETVASYDTKIFPLSDDILFDGKFVWVTSNSKLYKLNASGVILSSYDVPGALLAFNAPYLWIVDNFNKKLDKIDAATGGIVSSYDLPISPSGIASDKGYFWMADGNSKFYALRENPAISEAGGPVTRTFTISNPGSLGLVMNDFSVAGENASDFTVQNNTCAGKPIATFASCTFDLKFQSTSGGIKKAKLGIASNDPKTPNFSLLLTGSVPFLTVNNTNKTGGTVVSNVGGIACGSSCASTIASGSTVTLTAIPVDGYQFSGWSGDCSGYGNSCTLMLDTAKTVTANFAVFKIHQPVWKRAIGSIIQGGR